MESVQKIIFTKESRKWEWNIEIHDPTYLLRPYNPMIRTLFAYIPGRIEPAYYDV